MDNYNREILLTALYLNRFLMMNDDESVGKAVFCGWNIAIDHGILCQYTCVNKLPD